VTPFYRKALFAFVLMSVSLLSAGASALAAPPADGGGFPATATPTRTLTPTASITLTPPPVSATATSIPAGAYPAFVTQSAGRANIPEELEQSQPPARSTSGAVSPAIWIGLAVLMLGGLAGGFFLLSRGGRGQP